MPHYTDAVICTRRQQGDLINPLLFFQNEDGKLTNYETYKYTTTSLHQKAGQTDVEDEEDF
jgi:hypothetical protein